MFSTVKICPKLVLYCYHFSVCDKIQIQWCYYWIQDDCVYIHSIVEYLGVFESCQPHFFQHPRQIMARFLLRGHFDTCFGVTLILCHFCITSGNINIVIVFRQLIYVYHQTKKMPRVYMRKPGSRGYKNFSEETLEDALQQVVKGYLTFWLLQKSFKSHMGLYISTRANMATKLVGKQHCHLWRKERLCPVLLNVQTGDSLYQPWTYNFSLKIIQNVRAV